MVRFSCFHSHIHFHKPKKTDQPSVETMHKTMINYSQVQALKDLPHATSYNSLENTESGTFDDETLNLKKSHSLGNIQYLEEKAQTENYTEEGTDQGLSSDDGKDNDQHQKATTLGPFHPNSDSVKNATLTNDDSPQSEDNERHEETRFQRMIVKSRSVPNFGTYSPTSGGCSPCKSSVPKSTSSKDLGVLEMRQKDVIDFEANAIIEHASDHNIDKTEGVIYENLLDDDYESYSCAGIAKDWILPTIGESSGNQPDDLGSEDYKIKRIEEWVNDLHYCCPLEEETNELFQSIDQVKRDSNSPVGRIDAKVAAGMEASKRYISSLSAAATTAHLANHGLLVIPFLSAFVSLKVLNLSGNSIVKIIAGALPRSLHMLNLSKNNISIIEGFRELTRLRVLDLSYNRIIRLGHGLASCSSLKELYLAGNKISEVDGLHRLLKLSVLDLRFNKISTVKGLGQLAANYGSLQAISLEGNPAQKNVGDDQLKKYLQGLLPHLAYYNRQSTKASTLKDAGDRSLRLGGINIHQFDRSGLRLDHKATRKSGHGLSFQRPSSTSTHGHKIQAMASQMPAKVRPGRLPPTGTKVTTNYRQPDLDLTSKLLDLKLDLSVRRSRSEGNLGVI